jgi:hypothetical protein
MGTRARSHCPARAAIPRQRRGQPRRPRREDSSFRHPEDPRRAPARTAPEAPRRARGPTWHAPRPVRRATEFELSKRPRPQPDGRSTGNIQGAHPDVEFIIPMHTATNERCHTARPPQLRERCTDDGSNHRTEPRHGHLQVGCWLAPQVHVVQLADRRSKRTRAVPNWPEHQRESWWAAASTSTTTSCVSSSSSSRRPLRRGAANPGETRRPHVGGAFERHGLHREIYVPEVNETDPAKMRTILRQPVRIEHDRA